MQGETGKQIMYQLEWQEEHWLSQCPVVEQTCQQTQTLVNELLSVQVF